jgi:hypothetical protein
MEMRYTGTGEFSLSSGTEFVRDKDIDEDMILLEAVGMHDKVY